MSAEKNSPSWWTTLPGVITALAGLITAAGGFLVVLHTLGVFEKPKTPGDQIAVKEAEQRKTADETVTPKITPTKKVVPENHTAKGAEVGPKLTKTKPYVIPGTNRNFVEKNGHLVST